MRIAFSGAACTGKTTTLNAFLNKWPKYTVPQPTYRSIIRGDAHSKKTDKRVQKQILEFMLNQQKEYTPHQCIAYDRCGLDNIAYTLWAFEKGKKGFSQSFVDECIKITRETMRSLDIIFLLTRDEMGPIEQNNVRETDPMYITETDNIFKAIYTQLQTTGMSPFFPPNDSPALIKLEGTVEQRLEQISMYVTEDGNMYGEEQSLVNMDEIAKMESLLREQKGIAQKEKGILP
jgi:hypothetical protein